MMKFLNKKHKLLGNKGFSLVELIIVIAIMAVLIAILAPQYIKYVEKSRVATDDNYMGELKHNVEVLLAEESVYDDVVNGDTVTWVNSAAGLYALGSDSGELLTQLTAIMGATHDGASKTYDGLTYTITINVGADGTMTVTDTDPA